MQLIDKTYKTSGRRFVLVLRLDIVSNLAGMEMKLEEVQVQQIYQSNYFAKSEEISQFWQDDTTLPNF